MKKKLFKNQHYIISYLYIENMFIVFISHCYINEMIAMISEKTLNTKIFVFIRIKGWYCPCALVIPEFYGGKFSMK